MKGPEHLGHPPPLSKAIVYDQMNYNVIYDLLIVVEWFGKINPKTRKCEQIFGIIMLTNLSQHEVFYRVWLPALHSPLQLLSF